MGMRHLKLFEGFDKSQYYLEIGQDEANRIFKTFRSVPFSKEEQGLFKMNCYVDSFRTIRDHWLDIWDKVVITLPLPGQSHLQIWKLDDEWWFISAQRGNHTNITYYKCDGWDGLLEFLKDNEVIQ
jgi:hypothetical protein